MTEQGLGLSGFYNTMTTSMLVIPATAFDTSFVYDDIMTLDFQKIQVQGEISYIIADYEKASRMVNFSYGNTDGAYETVLSEAKTKMARRIMSLVKVYTAKAMGVKTVKEAIRSG